MVSEKKYNVLTVEQIQQLQNQGCSAQDWGVVTVADGFDPAVVLNTTFLGAVQIGSLSGSVAGPGGLEKPCGIYNATLLNCTIGDGTRIANIGVHLANYNIGDHVFQRNG